MIDWQRIQEIAHKFSARVKQQEREDAQQDIIVEIAEEWNKAGSLTKERMKTIAQRIIKRYQRARHLGSLDVYIDNGEGDFIPLSETIETNGFDK